MFKLNYASSEALLETLQSVASSEAIMKMSVAKADEGAETVVRVDVLSKGNAEQVTEALKAKATTDIEPVNFEAKAKAVATKLTAVLGTIDEDEAEEAEIEFRTGKSKLTIVGGLGKFETDLLSSNTELLPSPKVEESLMQLTVVGKDFRSALLYGSRGSADQGKDTRSVTQAVTLHANLKAGLLQIRSTNGELVTAACCKVKAFTKDAVEDSIKQQGLEVENPKAAKMLSVAEKMAANREAAGDENTVVVALSNERIRALVQFLKTAEAVQLLVGKNIITIQGGPRFYGCTLCAGTEYIFPEQLIKGVAESLRKAGRITVGSEVYARAVGNLLTATEGDRSKLRIKMTLDGDKTLLCTSSDNGELKVPVEKTEETDEFKGVTLKAQSIANVLKGLDDKIVIAVGGDKSPVGFYNAESPADGTLAVVLPIDPKVAEKAEKDAADKEKKVKKAKAEKPKAEKKPEESKSDDTEAEAEE